MNTTVLKKHKNNYAIGFTLAELLIALAILGVIATFTIPKILDSGQSSRNKAVAKEMASMIAGAYTSYKQQISPISTTTAGTITQYMNYVSATTVAQYGGASTPADGSNPPQDCSAGSGVVCLVLHNGGIMEVDTDQSFGGTSNTVNGWHMNADPDGTGNSAGYVTFIMYFNGRLTTGAVAKTEGTYTASASGGTLTWNTTDPSYITTWN